MSVPPSTETTEVESDDSSHSLSSNFESGNHSRLFQGPINIRSVALTGLFLYASLMVMYVAKGIMLPVFVALFLNLLLSPLVRGGEKYIFPCHLRPEVSFSF